MHGQWRYEITGDRPGQVIIDLDDMGGHYEGYVFVIYDQAMPSILAPIITKDRSAIQKITAVVDLVNPANGMVLDRAQIEKAFPSQYPTTLTATLKLKSRALHVQWETELGKGEVKNSLRAKQPSRLRSVLTVSSVHGRSLSSTALTSNQTSSYFAGKEALGV